MTVTERVRRLDQGDRAAVCMLLDSDHLQNCYLRSEVRLGALRTGTWWGVGADDRLSSVMAGGSLIVPWLGAVEDARHLARVLDRQSRPQLMTGPREHVHALHASQVPRPPTREVRDPQPFLVLERGRLRGTPSSRLRRSDQRDLDRLTVATAAMHREEMGVDPLAFDPAGWRLRMATLIDRGWSWVWVERGEVVFKAELSAWTPDACLVQGVYTAPGRRGLGIGTAGMAAVCQLVLAEVPLCSLYVNHYNAPARRLYATLGFEHTADFATLFF